MTPKHWLKVKFFQCDVKYYVSLCFHTKQSVLVYIASKWKAFIVLQLNLTTPKNAACVAAQHCSRNRDNAAFTINNSLSKVTIILLCRCVLQFQSHREEIDGLITESGLFLKVTFILSSYLAGGTFPRGREIQSLDLISWHNIHSHSPVFQSPHWITITPSWFQYSLIYCLAVASHHLKKSWMNDGVLTAS